MRKKLLSMLLVLSMLCSFMPVIVSADTSGISTLVNYITKYGTSTNDGTGKKIKDTTTSGNTTFVGEIIYSSSKNTIDFRYTSSEARMMANIGFTYNLTTNSCGYLIGLVQIYSSATATTPSQTYGCVSYDFNMKTYNKNTTLTFKSLDSGVSQSIVNTLNSQMNSLMKLGAISWDLMCIDAGTYLNRIGFDSYNVSSTPTPIPTYTISYNANGGTGAPSNQTAQSGNYITISSQIPTRNGYNFLGWSTSKTSQIATYTSGDYMKVTSNTTLYAVWQKISMPDTTGNTITISNAQINGNTISFTAKLSSNETVQGTILVVAYDINGALVDVKKYSAAASTNISFEKKDNYNTAKIFWWFDTESMYPMADSETLKLNEIQRTYSITKEYNSAYGSVTIMSNGKEISTAADGEEITITTSPNSGYAVLSQTVTDTSDNIIKITNNTFTMPNDDVKVTVNFVGAKDSGTFGINDNLTWLLDNNGTITISGSGQMQDFTTSNTPWNKYKEDIKIVVIKDGVTQISKNAFADCSKIKRVLIDKSVTEIESTAFKNCTDLNIVEYSGTQSDWEKIYIAAENEQLTNANVIYNSPLTDTAPTDLDYLKYKKNEDNTVTITGCLSDAANISIPNTIENLPVAIIGENAFSGCRSLTSITIPDSITSVGNSAFRNCSGLKNVTIGNGVKSIGNSAFRDCSGLNRITIPDGVKSIGSYMFYGCHLQTIIISDSVTSIGDWFINSYSSCDAIFYTGSSSQWNRIKIGSNNMSLTEITKYYNYVAK